MAAHRNRLRVRVRSCVTNQVLRYVSEREARIMCAENSDGSAMFGPDGKELEPIAHRLSRLKAPLTDIRLLARQRQERHSPCTLTLADAENNAFVEAFADHIPLSAQDSIEALDLATNKVAAWAETHDDRALVICGNPAGGSRIFGATRVNPEVLASL